MNNLKIIMTFTLPHEAHMAKGYMESEGVETIIQDELTAQVNNFYSNAIGGVKLSVKEEDFEKGLEILKKGGYLNHRDDLKKREIETVYFKRKKEKDHCPFCNSKNISKKKEADIIMVLLYFLFGALFPIMRHSYLCYDCTKEWKFIKEY